MPDKNQKIAKYIKHLVEKSHRPRNQISAFSGLSNPYIRDLEAGKFINVRREKLISLGIALSLNLREIDELLIFFDRTPLNVDDISIFLEVSKRKKISSALLVIRDGFPLELGLLSAERIQGRLEAVNMEPTYCLYSRGFRYYSEKGNVKAHPLYGELVEAISTERHRIFLENCKNSVMDHYICKKCLINYMVGEVEPEERRFRIDHVNNVIECLEENENFSLYLLNLCPSVIFTIKTPEEFTKETDKLFMTFWPRHVVKGKRSGRLSGFATDNPVIIQNFKEELDLIKKTVIPEYFDREKLVSFLKEKNSLHSKSPLIA